LVGRGMAQVVECLPSIHKALSSNPTRKKVTIKSKIAFMFGLSFKCTTFCFRGAATW
jgi:hypothetical protein